MGSFEAECVHLDPGDCREDDDPVYPRVVYSKKTHKSRSPTQGSMDSSGDPADRYSAGRPANKDVTRYSSTLKNMIPLRTAKASVRGSAKIDESGLFSFVTYSWVFEYLYQAFRGRLDKDQIWHCSVYDACNVNMARMEVLWEEELKMNPSSPSLFKTMYRFIKTRLWASCAVFLFCLIFGFIGPTCFIRGLIAFAENPPKNGESVDYLYGCILVASISIVEILRVLSYGATWAISYRTGIRVRGAILGLLYKRLIGLKTLGKKNPAEIVNMFANDGQRLFDAVTFAPLVLIGPLVLVGGIVYLLIVIGPWSLLGIAIFFIFDVIQYGLGKTMVRFRAAAIEKTEKRINLMGEILRCIRLIKMNAWEPYFEKRIDEYRHAEKVDIRVSGYAQSLAIACGPVVPVIAAVLTFLGVILSGNDLQASDAFSAMTVYFVMMFGIRMIPYGSRYMAEAVVALRRIQEMLLMEQWDSLLPPTMDSNHALRFKDASFAWTKPEDSTAATESTPASVEQNSFKLDDWNLVVKRKELVGICGAVGSGKSALLNSIIGHMYPVCGELEVGGSVAFVPQTPWIQNATLADNITFGLPMAAKYSKIINVTELEKDIEAMNAKDMTEIGERGATLSGGQRARVSLARALYANKDIYLLDDILASLDKKVADRIFESAVENLLQNKTVLMVTTDPQRLTRCDRVVFMDSGNLVATGPHEQLLDTCQSYKDFCASARYHEEVTTKRRDSNEGRESPEDMTELIQDAVAVTVAEDTGRLVDDEEDLGLASMKFSIYCEYIRAAGSWLVWMALFVGFVLNVTATIFSTYWLSRWLKTGHGEHYEEMNGTTSLVWDSSMADSNLNSYFAIVYGIALVVLFVSGLFKAMIFVKVSLNAGSRLHERMFRSVIRGATSFFDATPTGRILNRFSKDMDEIDVKLPFTVEVFLQNMITCVGFLIVIALVFPGFLLAAAPLFAVFLLFVLCFRAGIRSLKRSENVSRSPLFEHITTSLEGLQCVHSFGQTAHFVDDLRLKLDANSGAMFMFQSAMRWLAVWLDLLVVAVTAVVALFIVALTGTVSPADAGMAIAFAVQMSGIFQFAVRTQTELEAKMTSVERVAHYTKHIDSEGDWETKKGLDVPRDWPKNGQILFQAAKLRYRPKLPLALDDVNFEVQGGEKIGIIGRTGSGKSSLGNVLWRLYPLTSGRIFIDGVDISTVGLHRLRRAMAVIPQDPSLFQGTIRSNLDPCNEFTDSQIWEILEKTYLKTKISDLDKKLMNEVVSGGENFSVGERQLLCLTRALLMRSKIVLLDEATASLDLVTDKLIQRVITTEFESATVLLIAHRLENVYAMDKVLMMDDAKVLEFDRPDMLLNRSASHIHGLSRRAEDVIIPDEVEDDEDADVQMVQPRLNIEKSHSEEVSNSESSPELLSAPDSEAVVVDAVGDSISMPDDDVPPLESVDDSDIELINK